MPTLSLFEKVKLCLIAPFVCCCVFPVLIVHECVREHVKKNKNKNKN